MIEKVESYGLKIDYSGGKYRDHDLRLCRVPYAKLFMMVNSPADSVVFYPGHIFLKTIIAVENKVGYKLFQ